MRLTLQGAGGLTWLDEEFGFRFTVVVSLFLFHCFCFTVRDSLFAIHCLRFPVQDLFVTLLDLAGTELQLKHRVSASVRFTAVVIPAKIPAWSNVFPYIHTYAHPPLHLFGERWEPDWFTRFWFQVENNVSSPRIEWPGPWPSAPMPVAAEPDGLSTAPDPVSAASTGGQRGKTAVKQQRIVAYTFVSDPMDLIFQVCA